jgi:hypothetical protein
VSHKWLHRACWEMAGRPDAEAFEKPSKTISEEGYIQRESLWVITPDVTDEAERTQLLADGKVAHEKRVFDQMATELDNHIETNPEYMDEDEREFPYRQLFRVSAWSGNVTIIGRLRNDYHEFDGTPDEAEAECKRLYEEFMASDECKALKARRAELTAIWEAKQLAKFKEEGRYEVSRRPAKGDTIKTEGERDWTGSRSFFTVSDKLEYETIEEFDGPDKALGRKTFIADEERTEKGYASKEWEVRLDAIHAAMDESRNMAQALADRLNQEWADAGYPGRKDDSSDA